MTWWTELEKLREEQRPKRTEQPMLRLPVPSHMPFEPPEEPAAKPSNDDDDEPFNGVYVIDM